MTCFVPSPGKAFQLVPNVAVRGERQTLFRDGRPADVATQPFELLALIRRAATPACRENPATLPTLSNGSSHAGRVCSVKTLRPCWGPTAIRYVIDEPRS